MFITGLILDYKTIYYFLFLVSFNLYTNYGSKFFIIKIPTVADVVLLEGTWKNIAFGF